LSWLIIIIIIHATVTAVRLLRLVLSTMHGKCNKRASSIINERRTYATENQLLNRYTAY